jgi:GNAT superfamily N-acetyltransferase
MTDIRIRPLEKSDMGVFLTLVDAHADFEQMERPSPEARQRLIRDGLEDPPRYAAFLAAIDGEDVGYAITFEAYSSFLARPTFFLEDIFVLDEYRGRGFGGTMFQYLVEEAVRRGCGRMEWMVQDWNEGAIRFYERRGAIQLSQWHTYRITAETLVQLAATGEGGEAPIPDVHP